MMTIQNNGEIPDFPSEQKCTCENDYFCPICRQENTEEEVDVVPVDIKLFRWPK